MVLIINQNKNGTPFWLDLKTGQTKDINLDRIYFIKVSPDGKRLMYHQARKDDESEWDLFVSDAKGNSQERFAKMLVGFETEQTQIRTRCEQLRITIAEDKEASDSADRFVKLVRQFTNITELTTEIAATLIEKVIVSQAEKVDGQQRQEVRIIYNFIGDVSEEITE